jgi:hypothetical protein
MQSQQRPHIFTINNNPSCWYGAAAHAKPTMVEQAARGLYLPEQTGLYLNYGALVVMLLEHAAVQVWDAGWVLVLMLEKLFRSLQAACSACVQAVLETVFALAITSHVVIPLLYCAVTLPW